MINEQHLIERMTLAAHGKFVTEKQVSNMQAALAVAKVAIKDDVLEEAIDKLSRFAASKNQPSLNPYLVGIVNKAYVSAEKAKFKFPQPNYVLLKVAEEAGEVVQAGVHYAEGRAPWSDVEAETVQTIAMLFRLLTEGDEINGILPPTPKGE